ncbi:MAG: divergent PAP2 family protein [Lachnospiraceae bacterium]|nr:divergent PAP2 family protein [Lachnospiraceae bacterium]
MNSFNIADVISNRMLVIPLISWAIAQVIKTAIYAIVNKKIDIERLTGDGGMPSAHSATVCSLATTAAAAYGFSSGEFAITLVLAIIVMHDAMGVRREAGKHAKALNELLMMMSDPNEEPDLILKEFLGHTPLQVFFGALLGIFIAVVAAFFF